ncbi:glycosyltransferase family 2 protein [Polynucleobacter asymbioticus]|uniref:glycosyltransferase family 2 protein n=1 Tax=Polynucleobacter asymbioticus TaxID=576611 RepID=UPI0015D08A7D|nr:glycosyltransferase family 2 protein [Polynucleobacter asymbioticus]
MQPAVSIIMPAFNAEQYIAASIGSVLNQTFTNFELLVVNDCSSDNTRYLIEEIACKDFRVHLINLEKNFGAPAGPRNIGVNRALGNWVAFLDSDDIWHPEKLERQITLMEDTGAKFCSTQMINFRGESNINSIKFMAQSHSKITFLDQLIRYRTPTSSVVMDKAVALNHPFNESLVYKAREDLDCWLHCHEEIGESLKINLPLLGYRIVSGQISGKKSAMISRHYHVLYNYKLRSGTRLGVLAAVFTLSHFFLAAYSRFFKKGF